MSGSSSPRARKSKRTSSSDLAGRLAYQIVVKPDVPENDIYSLPHWFSWQISGSDPEKAASAGTLLDISIIYPTAMPSSPWALGQCNYPSNYQWCPLIRTDTLRRRMTRVFICWTNTQRNINFIDNISNKLCQSSSGQYRNRDRSSTYTSATGSVNGTINYSEQWLITL